MYSDADIIEVQGMFRVRLQLDDSAEQPYDDGATPILQLEAGRSDYVGGHRAEAFNKQAAPYLDAFRAFESTGQQLEVFERYLRIFHGAVKVQGWHTGYSREYGYLAFDTAAWRESVGAPDTLADEDYLAEVRAWAEGDVYGWVVEQDATHNTEGEEDWQEVESCWGFYGRDYAEQAAKEALTNEVANYSEPAAPPAPEEAKPQRPMAKFPSTLEADGSNLAGFNQRMLIDPLVGLLAVADELAAGKITKARAVEDIRALVGDHTAGLWHSVGQLTSRADDWADDAKEWRDHSKR